MARRNYMINSAPLISFIKTRTWNKLVGKVASKLIGELVGNNAENIG